MDEYAAKRRAERNERLATANKFELALGAIAWVIIYGGGTAFCIYILIGFFITS